jgi:Zn-dependent peptidase ImmA (M78 family)
VSDLLVFIAMHELWHFLCTTKQINCNNDERHADAFADVMVYKFTGKPLER